MCGGVTEKSRIVQKWILKVSKVADSPVSPGDVVAIACPTTYLQGWFYQVGVVVGSHPCIGEEDYIMVLFFVDPGDPLRGFAFPCRRSELFVLGDELPLSTST